MKKNIKLGKKKAIIGSIVIIALCISGFVVFKSKNSDGGEVAEETPEIYTVPGKEKIFVNGKVIPNKSEDFFIDGDKGELDEIKVEDGQKVEKGSALFSCKNKSAISEVEDLKEQIKVKENEKKNIEDELLKKSVESEIEQLNRQLKKFEDKAYSTVNAPFSGKVYINEQSQGENQTPSIMTLESEDFYIKGQASEQDLSKLSLNQEMEILVYSTKEKFKGKITFIGDRPSTNQSGIENMGNQNMSYYDIKINFLENQDLTNVKNGFHVQNTIEVSNKKIKVPYTSLIQEDEKRFLYKVIDGIVYKQEVKTEETNDEFAVVTEGVGENDEVIRYADDKNIKEGESIYPSKETSVEGEGE
ncbi:MAG: efflux RND transporter periplasmic adaptor subunit [Paraclostridium sp.]